MKYRVLENIFGLEKGEVFETNIQHDFKYRYKSKEEVELVEIANLHDIQFALKLGMIEEADKPWEPKENDVYWFIDSLSEPVSTFFNKKDLIDTGRVYTGNCFKTQEEAQAMAEKIKALIHNERSK